MRSIVVRAGLVAIGVVYVAMGFVSARVAFLGAREREGGVPGALRFLLHQPYGGAILGAVVAGLVGISIAHLIEAARGRRGVLARLGLAVSAFGYGILAWTAARLLLRLHQDRQSLPHAGITWLLGEWWGAGALEIVGGLVAVGGLVEAYQGARGALPFRRAGLPRGLARWLVGIARFGRVARGLVLAALGYFLIRSAEQLDPDGIRTVGGTLRAAHTAFGPLFMGVVALGLAAYGVYLWTLALLKRRV